MADCAERAPGLVVPPRKGTLVLWYNYRQDGSSDTRAIHAGAAANHAWTATDSLILSSGIRRQYHVMWNRGDTVHSLDWLT